MKTAIIISVLGIIFSCFALEVPLTVEEPIGAERKLEVVSGGIPFPEGGYKDYKAFSLYDGNKEIPVQVSPIVKYPDGSIHWGLVCFPLSIDAKSKKTYILKDIPGKVLPANPVVVKETGDIVEISNGLVSFTVNRANFNGFESIKLGDREIFKSAKAWLLANNQGGPVKPTYFDFVYRGPIRTTLYVKSPCGEQKTPTSAVVITLCAGEPVIRIEHNLRNGGIGVKSIDVVEPRFCLGGASEFKIGNSGRGNGPKASYGWQEFNGPADVMVFLRHGGTSHTRGKDLDYSANVVGGELVVNLAMVRGNPTRLTEGEHKISEITLVFSKSFSPEAILAPLHALAPCSYYAQHDSMGVGRGFGSLEDETTTYKSAGWKKYDDPKKMPVMKPAPDLWYNWLSVHETSECDQIQGMLFGYIRTGQRGYLDQAMAWQRYYRTFYMYRTDDFTYGKEGHRAGLEKFGGGRTCAGGCHTYGVGIFNYALLTGNVDALEAAFDLAEQCNAISGTYSKIKPGAELGFWGSRGFVRNFLAVARAYDVARTPEWEERLIHFVNSSVMASDRDPRGFINHGHVSAHPQKYIDQMANPKHEIAPEAIEMQTKEGITLVNGKLTHPKYGSWRLKQFGSWPEAMEATAHLVAYETLSTSTNPIALLAADDAMDLAIVKAELGLHYAFDPVQKAVYYYMFLDYPIPGYAPLWKGGKWKQRIEKGGSDSWYTKWWPNPMAGGYLLTGDKRMLERCFEVLWWGLSRNYVHPPLVPEGEAPPYAQIDTSTKNDWMTTTALAFGVCARPKKDELPPEPITNLSARTLGNGKVELTWKAPTDKGGGKIASYQLKYAEMPIDDYPVDGEYLRKNWKDGNITVTYWNMAKNVLGEPRPSAPGTAEKMSINMPAGKKLWLAIRSFDNSHNRSDLSNIVEVDIK